MSPTGRRQEQSGGEGSANFQAGRDIVHVGMSHQEVREIALDVFRSNFLELRGVAEEVALGRAEKVTNEFLSKLAAEAPAATSSFADPDVQRAVFEAQREFACSGEEDLGQVLVDLLVDRVQEDERNLRSLALNEAITAASKLTEQQRCAVGVVFLHRYTRVPIIAPAAEVLEKRLRENLLNLPPATGIRDVDLQHIEYVGAGTVSMRQLGFGEILLHAQTSAFTRGFAEDEVPPALRNSDEYGRLVQTSFRDSQRLQLRAPADQDVDELLPNITDPELRSAVDTVRSLGRLTAEEVTAEVREFSPQASALANVWDSTTLKNLTLTSVGIALGHAYWRRFGGSAPLSAWL